MVISEKCCRIYFRKRGQWSQKLKERKRCLWRNPCPWETDSQEHYVLTGFSWAESSALGQTGGASAGRRGGRLSESSPRAWGCFRFLRARYRRDRVFPTCVGVFPLSHWRPLCHSCLPHVRGGVSARVSAGRRKTSSSPRAWGGFFSLTDTRLLYRVFPTCVGVFLIRS